MAEDKQSHTSGTGGEQDALRRTAADVEAAMQAAAIIGEASQAVMGLWLEYASDAASRRAEAMRNMGGIRTPADLMQAQGDQLRAEVQLFIQHARRVADRSSELMRDATERASRVLEDEPPAGDGPAIPKGDIGI